MTDSCRGHIADAMVNGVSPASDQMAALVRRRVADATLDFVLASFRSSVREGARHAEVFPPGTTEAIRNVLGAR